MDDNGKQQPSQENSFYVALYEGVLVNPEFSLIFCPVDTTEEERKSLQR